METAHSAATDPETQTDVLGPGRDGGITHAQRSVKVGRILIIDPAIQPERYGRHEARPPDTIDANGKVAIQASQCLDRKVWTGSQYERRCAITRQHPGSLLI